MQTPRFLQPLLAAAFFVAVACPHLTSAQEATLPAATESADGEKKVEPYAHQSSKGTTYYLFGREQKVRNSDKTFMMYFFAKDPENKKGTPLAEVPEDRVVSETKTALLVLKKKAPK